MTAGGIVRRPTGAEELRILLSARENADALGVVEMVLAAGATGPPLHVHPTHGEGFFVLTGELTVQLGDEVIVGGPGTWAFAPRDTPHSLANLGHVEARLLCVFAPGGFERRFERMLARTPDAAASPEPSVAEASTRVVGRPAWARS